MILYFLKLPNKTFLKKKMKTEYLEKNFNGRSRRPNRDNLWLWLNTLAFSRPLQKRYICFELVVIYLKTKQISHPRSEPVDKSEIEKVYMKCSFDAFQGHVLPLVHNIG